jgi:hypothetical protein
MVDHTQVRLLVLTSLLLCTTLVLRAEGKPNGSTDSVFQEPPAYLHPREAIGFDVSGLDPHNPTDAELLAATQQRLDVEARAHAHLALAVYYKTRGLTQQAVLEKRKGEYWRRIARYVPPDSVEHRR